MSKFPSDKHFASWLGLCPGTKITGGKVMSGKTKRCANRAAQACLAASGENSSMESPRETPSASRMRGSGVFCRPSTITACTVMLRSGPIMVT
ncbi:MAG: transposase [Alphaproteobacteria bacterium]